MLKTLRTLMTASSAQSEARVRDRYAIDLIDQKIREADGNLRSAKTTLASLIQRQRLEQKNHDALTRRISDMTERACKALSDGADDLAHEAATAIAGMEDELAQRRQTLSTLDQKVIRLRSAIETMHRRIVDLKQGAAQARAVRHEQAAQMRLAKAVPHAAATEEAAELIAAILNKADPVERTQIMAAIDQRVLGHVDHDADARVGEFCQIPL